MNNGKSLTIFFLILLFFGCGSKQQDRKTSSEYTISPPVARLLLQSQQAANRNDYLTALAFADSALQYDQDNPQIHFLKGIIQENLHWTEQAKASYEKAYEINPDIPGVKFSLANMLFKYQQYDSALALYKQSLQSYDRENEIYSKAKGYINLGVTYSRIGNRDSALAMFEQALQEDDTYAETYYLIAREYKDNGEVKTALDYIRKALEHNPDNIDYHFEAGSLCYQLGYNEEALYYFQTVIDERPWNYRATYFYGQALLRLGQRDKAQQNLAKADTLKERLADIVALETKADQEPDNMINWSELARAYNEIGDHQRSKDALLVALSLDPQNLVLQNNLAHICLLLDQPAEAASYFENILRADPTLADVWTNLGIVYAKMSEYVKAEQAWKNALKHRPEHPVAKSYLKELSRSG